MTEFQADFADFRKQLSPMSVSGAVRQTISLAWILLPPDNRSVKSLRGIASEFFKRALDWWGSVHDLPAETMGQRLTEELEIGSESSFNFAHMAEMSLRQAMFCCYLLLPEPRRNSVEVAKLVAQMLERALDEVDDDFRMFA